MGSERRVIRVRAPGGPEALEFTREPIEAPAPGEIQVRHEAIGVNMIDTYVTSGAYRIEPFPLVPGVEGAGIVTAVGRGVADFREGDPVAYGGPPLGAYADVRNMPPAYVVRRPASVPADHAAAAMIAGLTAYMMVRLVYPVGTGSVVLVHAAAGSTGAAIASWAAHLGAHVIGTVGDEKKRAAALANGCRDVINYRATDYADVVLQVTAGRGADVAYDGIGRDTFDGAFRALKPTGMFVTYGQASGPLPPIALHDVPVTFSHFIARPSVFSFFARREDFVRAADAVFAAIDAGTLSSPPRHRYPLAEAATAHRDLLARRTAGSIVLMP
jgi:NADPH2:quinone reductase